MNELALFAGGCGGVLGTHHLLGWRTIGYVEIDDYCQKIIAARIRDGLLDEAPIFGDLRAFIDQGYAASYTGLVDVVTAGFPCQPYSLAGKRLGKDDERNKWPETAECIRIVRPRFALLENVPGLLSTPYWGTVLGDLAESGYDVRWDCFPASAFGAPHERDRLFALAYPAETRLPNFEGRCIAPEKNRRSHARAGCSSLDDADRQRREARRLHLRPGRPEQAATVTPWTGEVVRGHDGEYRKVAPGVPLLAYGMAGAMERLATTGQGQVPIVAASAWHLLTKGLT